MRERAADFEAALTGRDEFVPARDSADAFNLLRRPAGEAGQGAGPDLAVLAVAFAKKDSGWRAAVRNGGNEHEPSGQAES
jgi:hypothetical protein